MTALTLLGGKDKRMANLLFSEFPCYIEGTQQNLGLQRPPNPSNNSQCEDKLLEPQAQVIILPQNRVYIIL